MRYELQVLDWTRWVPERCFASDVEAKEYAREHYSQNDWQIYDRAVNRVVHQYNSFSSIQQIAAADLGRFQNVRDWTENHRLELAAKIQRRIRARSSRHSILKCWPGKDRVNWKKEGF